MPLPHTKVLLVELAATVVGAPLELCHHWIDRRDSWWEYLLRSREAAAPDIEDKEFLEEVATADGNVWIG